MVQGQWLCIHSSPWALPECPRVTCSPHSSPPLRFCEQGLTSPHSPQGRRGVCREKQLGTRVGDQLPQWCARPRVSESRSGSGRVETQCLHMGPQCKLVVVHAFRELGGVRLQASKHGLPPTPVGGPDPLPSSLPAQHPLDGAEINAPSEGVGALPAPQQPQPSLPSKTPASGRLFRLNLGLAP